MTESTSEPVPGTENAPAPGPESGAGAEPPRTYEVRINGPVAAGTEELLAELGEVVVTGHDVTTVLSGWFADQQALADFLHRLRSYGLEVVEIRRVAEDDDHGDPGTGHDPPRVGP